MQARTDIEDTNLGCMHHDAEHDIWMIRFNLLQERLSSDYVSLLQVQHRQVWDDHVVEKMLEVDPSLTESVVCLDLITVKPIGLCFEFVYICVYTCVKEKNVFLRKHFDF